MSHTFRCNAFEVVLILTTLFAVPLSLHAGDAKQARARLFEANNKGNYNNCGFHIIARYLSSRNSDPSIKSLLQTTPTSDTSILSSSGRFRIFFDTSGVNEPFLYDSDGKPISHSDFAFADSAAKIADYVYNIEVDSLGFPPAVASDSGAGGGNEYEIYVESLPTGEYGYTDFDESRPLINRLNPTYATWMVIRNEFESTYTKGIAAMEVTIAHEYHHGIQLGDYGLWPNDIWFYELTSTWMEQVVYPQVKDYYQYLPAFFSNVALPFNAYIPSSYAGFERCVFGIFVQQEYPNVDLMKLIWQDMAHEPAVPAIEDAFKSIGVNPSYAFQLFAQWNYLAGYRASTAAEYGLSTYPQAANYPSVAIAADGDLTATGVDFFDSALPLTEHFYQVNDGPDTIGIAVVNNNFGAAISGDTLRSQYTVGISTNDVNCVKQISGGYCMFLSVASYSNWAIVPFIFGGALIARNDVVFPQPYNPPHGELKIPYPFQETKSASLSIYGISGQLVDRMIGDQDVQQYLRGKYFVWNGRDSSGKVVNSGVYIYVLSDGSKSVMGKFAVVRNQ